MKICLKCKTEKSEVEFYRERNSSDGLARWCKSCRDMKQRKWRLEHPGYDHELYKKRCLRQPGYTKEKSRKWRSEHPGDRYGITLADYNLLLHEQQGRCAVCNILPEGKLHIDHCHKTGKVRGLLCGNCNRGLGMLKDSGEFLIKAAVYLGYSYGAGVLSANTLRRLKPVEPFIERTVIGGMSAGLSVAGYDVRIRENLKLPPDAFSLASTVEKFDLPKNVMAWMKDKSSWARQGLSVFNTCLEPGWKGFLTLELKNLGQESLTIASGSPIAQAVFAFTDEPTEGYSGKYNNQEASPQKFRPEQTP